MDNFIFLKVRHVYKVYLKQEKHKQIEGNQIQPQYETTQTKSQLEKTLEDQQISQTSLNSNAFLFFVITFVSFILVLVSS